MKTIRWDTHMRFDLDGQERWLEHMASKGLLASGRFGSFIQFVKGAPAPHRRYRLVAAGGQSELRLMDLFVPLGWNSVGSWTRYFFLFYTDDPDALEPYTDCNSHGLSLESVRKEFSDQANNIAIRSFVLLFFAFLGFRQDSRSLNSLYNQLFFCAVLALFALLAFWDWRFMREMCLRLEEGDNTPLSIPWWMRWVKVLAGLSLLVLICSWLYPMVEVYVNALQGQ